MTVTELTPRQHAEIFHKQAKECLQINPHLATKFLLSAAQVDPTWAEPWYLLGAMQGELGSLTASVALFRKALSCDLSHVKALVNLGFRSYWLGEMSAAESALQQALAIDLGDHQAWVNLSLVQSVNLQLQDSLDSARRAISLCDDDQTRLALAFAQLYKGDFAEGLKNFEYRYKHAKDLKFTESFPWPRWTGEELAGRNLLVISDQGIGDTMSFMHFVPAAAQRAGKVNLMVHPELVRVTQAAMLPYPNVSVLAAQQNYPETDMWTSFMSLPVGLELTSEEIRNQEDVYWPQFHYGGTPFRHQAKFHIGICWSGNKDCAIEKWRKVPVEMFAPLALLPDVQLYSLQLGPTQVDLHNTGLATLIPDLSPLIRDIGDTIGILGELDFVITTDTALGHICGAIGKPCWVLCSRYGGDFRLGREGDAPLWYKNHRLFRQGPDAAWFPVFQDLLSAIIQIL